MGLEHTLPVFQGSAKRMATAQRFQNAFSFSVFLPRKAVFTVATRSWPWLAWVWLAKAVGPLQVEEFETKKAQAECRAFTSVILRCVEHYGESESLRIR